MLYIWKYVIKLIGKWYFVNLTINIKGSLQGNTTSLDLTVKWGENLGDFRRACIYFNVSFPHYCMSCYILTNQTISSTISKKMQSTSLEYSIEYQVLYRSNFRSMKVDEKVWLLVKKYFHKLTGRLKLCHTIGS